MVKSSASLEATVRAPLVSVLIPVHNAADTLDELLHDLSAQDIEAFEGLLVLNGITDASREIAEAHALNDPRIVLIERDEPGIVEALNEGLRCARSSVIARMDADDRMAPQRLRLQRAALDKNPDWSLVTCQVDCEMLGGGVAGSDMVTLVTRLNTLSTPDALAWSRYIDFPVIHPAVMYRKEAVLRVGGYRMGAFGEDHDLWLRMLEDGQRFGMVADRLVTWRDHPHRMTRNDPRLQVAAMRRLVVAHLKGKLGAKACTLIGHGESAEAWMALLDEADVLRCWIKRPNEVTANLKGDNGLYLVVADAPSAMERAIAVLQGQGLHIGVDWFPLSPPPPLDHLA